VPLMLDVQEALARYTFELRVRRFLMQTFAGGVDLSRAAAWDVVDLEEPR